MDNEKIILTDQLRKFIRSNRIERKITTTKLVEGTDRTQSYISLIEGGKIAKVSTTDLIAIFKNLFDISDEEAMLKINSLINRATPSDQDDMDFDDSEDDPTDEISTEQKIVKYKDLDEFINPELFKKMLRIINKVFMSYYKHNSKDAFVTVNTLIRSFKSDIGFTMVLLSLPYERLNDLSHEEKQKILDDLVDFFKPYFDKASKSSE